MKTLEDLTEYYQKVLLPLLSNFEEDRRTLQRKNRIYTPIAGLAGFLLLYFLLPYIARSGRGLIIILSVYAAVPTIIFHNLSKKYRNSFKHTIIKKLIHFISPQLYYYPERSISRQKLASSGLFPPEFEDYSGDDLVKGTIEKTTIELSEVHLTFRPSDFDVLLTSAYKGKDFNGLFISADFHKHFKGNTFVLPKSNKFEKALKKMQAKIDPSIQFVQLDDPVFNETFMVFATDQIEARYILSPNMMERLYRFKEKTEFNISVSFVNSQVNIAIPVNKLFFEPHYTVTAIDFEPIQEYFEDIQLAVGIVEDLNLNTRIWSKE